MLRSAPLFEAGPHVPGLSGASCISTAKDEGPWALASSANKPALSLFQASLIAPTPTMTIILIATATTAANPKP